MSSSSDIFQTSHALRFSERTRVHFESYDFLYDWAARDIVERLSDITRDFSSVLLCGEHTANYLGEKFPDAAVMENPSPELLVPFAEQYDLIIVMGEFHRSNDLPGLLVQLRRALKPDGVMISAFAGGETLRELRAALLQGEINVMGGASPRVFPFADKQQMAGLLQRAGFTLPVVDSEILSVSYRDMFHLMSDVRGMGESNCLVARHRRFTPSRVFSEAAQFYQKNFVEQDGRVSASFEIIFLIGWAPHESQQKPAKRGSGQVSLTEIL